MKTQLKSEMFRIAKLFFVVVVVHSLFVPSVARNNVRTHSIRYKIQCENSIETNENSEMAHPIHIYGNTNTTANSRYWMDLVVRLIIQNITNIRWFI